MEECFGSFANVIADNQASTVQTYAGSQWEQRWMSLDHNFWKTVESEQTKLSSLGRLLQSNHEGVFAKKKKVPAVASF